MCKRRFFFVLKKKTATRVAVPHISFIWKMYLARARGKLRRPCLFRNRTPGAICRKPSEATLVRRASSLPTLRTRPEAHKGYTSPAAMIIIIITIIMTTRATRRMRNALQSPPQKRPLVSYWPDIPSPEKGCHGRRDRANAPIGTRSRQNKRHAHRRPLSLCLSPRESEFSSREPNKWMPRARGE